MQALIGITVVRVFLKNYLRIFHNEIIGIYNNGEPLVTVFNAGLEPTNKLLVSKIITENSKRNEYYTSENVVNSIGEYQGKRYFCEISFNFFRISGSYTKCGFIYSFR